VSYVVAGYVICLSVLTAYAAWLLARRRRLTRAAALAEEAGAGAASQRLESGHPPGTGT
jgi:hypothetical protein